jgi:diguanylate cyclase (GGDEF)-like protein
MDSQINQYFTDELTGFRLHINFEADLEGYLIKADNSGSELSLVLIDADELARLNKMGGQLVGDEVLVTVARHIKTYFPDGLYYRYGGDSFALLLPGVEKELAFLFTERAREALSHVWIADAYNPTISAGVATYRVDGTNAAELIRKADGALYRAKASGRNKVAISREDKMLTKTSHYSIEQLQRLTALAKQTGSGEAFLLREALTDLLKKYDDKRRYVNGKTAIIIDDSSLTRATLRSLLTKRGYTVLADFENGKHAAAFYNSVPADYVLLDLVMPEMDGIEFLKSIYKHDASRIIVVSVMAKEALLLSAVEYGADYFIVKPYSPDNLLNVMSWEKGYLNPEKLDVYRSYLRGKRYGEDATLSQAEIDALRML